MSSLYLLIGSLEMLPFSILAGAALLQEGFRRKTGQLSEVS